MPLVPVVRWRPRRRLPSPVGLYPPSPLSDDEFSSSSTVCTDTTPSPSCGPSASPDVSIEGLHSPLESDDERLLSMPPLPTFSMCFSRYRCCRNACCVNHIPRHDAYFTPSWGIDDDGAYDYVYNSAEEEYTILSTWCIIKRASLPIDTFCLASLILKKLGYSFYCQWSMEMYALYRGRRLSRTREVIIVAACVCSQIPLSMY